MTITQLAELLGVSRMTIHRMRQAGELPPIVATQRRVVRWIDADIHRWLDWDCPSTAEFRKLKKTQQKFARK